MISAWCAWCGRDLAFAELCACRTPTLAEACGLSIVESVVCTAFAPAVENAAEKERSSC